MYVLLMAHRTIQSQLWGLTSPIHNCAYKSAPMFLWHMRHTHAHTHTGGTHIDCACKHIAEIEAARRARREPGSKNITCRYANKPLKRPSKVHDGKYFLIFMKI